MKAAHADEDDERGRRSEGGGARKQVWAGAGAEANRGWQVDGPEQIEAERMGGSGDGRWASSSSVADTRMWCLNYCE